MPPLFTSTVFRPWNKPPRPGKWWLDRTRRHDLMIRYATIATKEISKFYLNGQVLQTVSSLSMGRHRLKADRCGKCTVSLLNFAVNSSKRATDPLCTKPVISFHPFSSHFVWFDHFRWIEFAFDRSKGGRPWSTHAHKIGKRSETKNYVLPYVGRKIKKKKQKCYARTNEGTTSLTIDCVKNCQSKAKLSNNMRWVLFCLLPANLWKFIKLLACSRVA